MHCLWPRQRENISAKTLMVLKPRIFSPANFSLSTVFKASVEQGKLPDDWKLAYITSIFKKGNRRSAVNYQPISFTSICCKALEHILHSSIFTHLERRKVLCEQQHGFQSGRSCEPQLLGTVHDFPTCLNNGGHIDALFLDMAKAFDKVPHQHLCAKVITLWN